ncbi:uncharacterized protein LOC101237488 isoform X1 [Hydra vulgaris]|uniref:uncharacterized protein LOC101237488 isoform X1 n=1 Tax=Hydra vulgaris TaxID=6087 RepID=UPI0032EA5A06
MSLLNVILFCIRGLFQNSFLLKLLFFTFIFNLVTICIIIKCNYIYQMKVRHLYQEELLNSYNLPTAILKNNETLKTLTVYHFNDDSPRNSILDKMIQPSISKDIMMKRYMENNNLELSKNTVYKSLNVLKLSKPEQINMILIVSSAPSRFDRRLAIRQTWWKQCKSTSKLSVKCVFLTDWKDPKTDGLHLLLESYKYGDIYFQNLTGGYDFGKRFLYHMAWAMQNFIFDYFLRTDDDYFLCIKKLLDEIPMPPKNLYHWGWVHCIKDMVRPDESIILLSKDLIEKFLYQDPQKMLCHRWGGQMIGIWINNLGINNFRYKHDTRLHHDPPAEHVPYFNNKTDICSSYIGIHGSYPSKMRSFWNSSNFNTFINNKTLDEHCVYCKYNQTINWKLFFGEWKAEPKLCKDNPNWGGMFGATYPGRQGP